jgi:MFS family permease
LRSPSSTRIAIEGLITYAEYVLHCTPLGRHIVNGKIIDVDGRGASNLRSSPINLTRTASPAQLWMLAMLTLALVLAFADRGLLSILVDPIKKDLRLTDLQMSYLLGFSFSAVYSIAALPLGYLVDRVNRRSMIAICIGTWSIMTGYACFANSFGQLFIARMGLGIAEAALAPAAFSMIRDSFSLTQRARAFAVLNSAHLIGGGSALLVGGALLGFASNGGLDSHPFLQQLHPWQFVLIAVGVIGLPFGLAFFFSVREPGRPSSVPGALPPTFADAGRFIQTKKGILIPLWLGYALFTLAQGGLTAWVPMVAHRGWDIPIPAVGKTLGPLMMVVAPLGSFFMGWLMDRSSGRGHRNATVRTCAIAMTAAAVVALAQFFVTDVQLAMLLYVVQVFLFASFTVATSASLAQITPSPLSGKLQAITGLASSLVGLALGPTVVALVSDNMFAGVNALHYGLVVTVAAAAAGGAIFYFMVAAKMRQDDGQLQ